MLSRDRSKPRIMARIDANVLVVNRSLQSHFTNMYGIYYFTLAVKSLRRFDVTSSGDILKSSDIS